MRANKFTSAWITVIVSFAGLLVGTARAGDSSFASPTYGVTVKLENVRRTPAPLRVFMTVRENKFTFLTPDGWQARDDQSQRRIITTSPNQACTVTVRIVAPLPEGATYRAVLLSRYPDAKIVDESTKKAAGWTGTAYGLEMGVRGVVQTAWVAFIPSSVGILEFTSLGTERVEENFNTVLRSFSASDADGKLEIPVGSDEM